MKMNMTSPRSCCSSEWSRRQRRWSSVPSCWISIWLLLLFQQQQQPHGRFVSAFVAPVVVTSASGPQRIPPPVVAVVTRVRQSSSSRVVVLLAKSTNQKQEQDPDDDSNNPPRVMAEKQRMRQQQLDAIVNRNSDPNINNSNNNSQSKNKKERAATVQKIRQGQAASQAMDLPEQPLVKTLPGGTQAIFAMARQMARINTAAATLSLREENDEEEEANVDFNNNIERMRMDAGREDQQQEYGMWSSLSSSNRKRILWDTDDLFRPSPPKASSGRSLTTTTTTSTSSSTLPRWHPVRGIWDDNPRFRTEPPRMTSAGYAATLWRHARKRRQPALWRYAVRTFERISPRQRQAVHYEGVLAACAKLGWADRAWELCQEVIIPSQPHQSQSSSNNSIGKQKALRLTDTMVTLLLRASVRQAVHTQSREPLDRMRDLLLSLTTTNENNKENDAAEDYSGKKKDGTVATASSHNLLQLTTVHWNPLAAAYARLGYGAEATELLWTQLGDRIGNGDRSRGPLAKKGAATGGVVSNEKTNFRSGTTITTTFPYSNDDNAIDNNDVDSDTGFNVYDVQAKDHGSYAIAIGSAVQAQDYVAAIARLRDMTETGRLFPQDRHLNAWNEMAEQRTRGVSGSWKKQREAALLAESRRLVQALLVEKPLQRPRPLA